jgi:hypothetical protein
LLRRGIFVSKRFCLVRYGPRAAHPDRYATRKPLKRIEIFAPFTAANAPY